ncbi:MAG: tetratricopeptide repeat protein [Thermodesulfobacteriota bacterium]
MDEQATPQSSEKKHEKINGVFSTQVISKVGTGTTVRKTVKKTYWFVDETDTGEVDIQPLNVNYVPSGPKRKVSKDEFLEKFSPEPEFYINTVYPKMREMNMAVIQGEKHRERGETFSAELEFNHALTIDEENVRANFGLGLTYLERGNDTKANDIFQRLVKLEAAFEAEHKHLFNEFGINLRKNKMYDQSVEYYQRALGLSEVDENLHYNIARAWFEKQNFAKVKEHLEEALRLNPNFEEGRKFLDYLVKKNLVPGGSAAPGAKNGGEGGGKPSSGPLNVDL